MTEPIDIETLDPLYRDVFRDSANGAPDKISAAGCMALAKRGSQSWNAWRKAFPSSRDNNAKFQKINGFEFENFKNFDFGEDANFNAAIFKSSHTSFEGAIFGANARFVATMFLQGVSFKKTVFKGKANFYGANFGREVNFQESIFNGETIFRAAEWTQISMYYGFDSGHRLGIDVAKENAIEFFTNPSNFPSVKFDAVSVLGAVDFNGRKFLSTASFKDVRFHGTLNFHNCDINTDTSFHGTKFSDPTGNFEQIRTYNVLKLAFSKHLNP